LNLVAGNLIRRFEIKDFPHFTLVGNFMEMKDNLEDEKKG
jgi:hypothetical protein